MAESPKILAESGVDGLPHIVMMILTDTGGDDYNDDDDNVDDIGRQGR